MSLQTVTVSPLINRHLPSCMPGRSTLPQVSTVRVQSRKVSHTLCTLTLSFMPISSLPARLFHASSCTYAGINLHSKVSHHAPVSRPSVHMNAMARYGEAGMFHPSKSPPRSTLMPWLKYIASTFPVRTMPSLNSSRLFCAHTHRCLMKASARKAMHLLMSANEDFPQYIPTVQHQFLRVQGGHGSLKMKPHPSKALMAG